MEIKGKAQKPILSDPDETYKFVSRTFELRHIYCHEFASNEVLDPKEIDQCFNNTILFLKASDAYFNNVLFPDSPLTQTDMNKDSAKKRSEKNDTLIALNRELIGKLDEDQQKKYDEIHSTWEKFMSLSVDLEGHEYNGGSIRPLIENMAAVDITEGRIDQVKNLIKSINVI